MRRIVASPKKVQETQEIEPELVDAPTPAQAMFAVAIFCVSAVTITLPRRR
jgi:hypothetical protein